jgi:O-antigen biosynthesis protein
MPSLRRARAAERANEAMRVPAPPGLLEVLRDGPTGLEQRAVDADALSVVFCLGPPGAGDDARRAAGEVAGGLEAMGHTCSVWTADDAGPSVSAGADVAVAAGWKAVPQTLRLPGLVARAQLVLDHEPDLYAASASREWAAWTYRQGLPCLAAGAWLAEQLRRRYGADATPFERGVDHSVYRPLPIERRDDLVLLFARSSTPRHALPLGALAMHELHRRRGAGVRVVLVGERRPLDLGVRHETLGVLEPDQAAEAYNAATVGVVLDLTNPSPVASEMLACGLPVVNFATAATRAAFGDDGPVALAPVDPLGVCDAIEALLADFAQRAERTRHGLELVAPRTFAAAAAAVSDALRAAVGGAPRR